jgi:phage portal protein BeeE
MTPAFSGSFGQWSDQAKYTERYNLFRNWVYAAINAIALEAAAQPVRVGKIRRGKKKNPNERKSEDILSMQAKSKMTTSARQKAAEEELEVLNNHPLLKTLQVPNPIQGRDQFVYSFVANLCLTGWAFVVLDHDDDGNPEYYSLPTTWIKPDHAEGPFSRFKIVDPKNPNTGQQSEWLTREQVGFAHLPNPADPMSALAPAASQMGAIRINDHIETSRERFFNNGIFPSVVVTVGKDPHPDVPGGMRPRLTNEQRRQIYSVISKTMGGVANYGAPAIVDGLIESVTRFSMTDPEMGWEKSEESVKTNILSAFCVHPYLLGEAVNVGGYAQVANIEKRFYKRVNAYLDMLGGVITGLVGNDEKDDAILIWWEKCEAEDPTRTDSMLRFARQNNDISQNEFRAKIGFPPDEDRSEQRLKSGDISAIISIVSQVATGAITSDQAVILVREMGIPEKVAKEITTPKGKEDDKRVRNVLLSTVGGLNGAVAVVNTMGQGMITAETASKLIALFYQITEEEAMEIVKSSEKKPEPQQPGMEGMMGGAGAPEQAAESGGTPEQGASPTGPGEPQVLMENPFAAMGKPAEEETVEKATKTLERALTSLFMTPEEIAQDILNKLHKGFGHG